MYLTIQCVDGNYNLYAWQKLYMKSDTIRLMLDYDHISDVNVDEIKQISERLAKQTEYNPLKCNFSDFSDFHRVIFIL